MDTAQLFAELAHELPSSAAWHHPIAPEIAPKGKEGQAPSNQEPICESGRPPRNRRAPKRYNADKGVWEWIDSVSINCSHWLLEHGGDIGLSPIELSLNYWPMLLPLMLCIFMFIPRCQSLFDINIISEQQVFLYAPEKKKSLRGNNKPYTMKIMRKI